MNGAVSVLPSCAFMAAQGQLCPFLADTFRGIRSRMMKFDRTVIGNGRENKYVQNFGWKT